MMIITSMDMLQRLIKKQRFKKSTVTINDVGLRSVHSWKNNVNKKIIFLEIVLLTEGVTLMTMNYFLNLHAIK